MTNNFSSNCCLALFTPPSIASGQVGYRSKRWLDLAVALPLFVLLLPLLVVIAAAIRGTSPGPALFRQRRLGQHERAFTLWKFRTMRADAPQTGPPRTVAGDPRITALGRWLRATSFDELPQLWNVIRGEMSLIGPRPYVGFELADWSSEDRVQRAQLKPGLTGLAQVSGRSHLTPDQVRNFDLHYVAACSLSLDLSIAYRTFSTVLSRRGVT